MLEAEETERKRYTREFLLEFREKEECRRLPPGLEPDDLSDLSESAFFDKSPSENMYLGPQGVPPGSRHSALIAGGGRGFGRGGGIHSRLVDDGTMPANAGSRNGNAGMASAFGNSPSKGIPITGHQRYEDPARMDRWDSRKASQSNIQSPPSESGSRGDNSGSWTQVGPRRGGGSTGDWRSDKQRNASIDLQRGASGNWGGRGNAGGEERTQSGSLPKDLNASRWSKGDDSDWRARKQAGAAPEPRYDWTDRVPGATGAAAGRKGPNSGMPEWAEEDSAPRLPMTAEDIEAERQRMQAEWRKSKGPAGPQHEEQEQELVDDDEIEMWKKEQEEEERKEREAAASGVNNRPMPGQHVDVKALFGGGGSAAPVVSAGEQEQLRSRFEGMFNMNKGPGAMVPPKGPPGFTQGPPAGAGPSAGDAGKHLLAMLQKTGQEQQMLGEAESVATGIALGGLDDELDLGPPRQPQLQHQRPMGPAPGMANNPMANLLAQAQQRQHQHQPGMPHPQQLPPGMNFPPPGGMRPPPGVVMPPGFPGGPPQGIPPPRGPPPPGGIFTPPGGPMAPPMGQYRPPGMGGPPHGMPPMGGPGGMGQPPQGAGVGNQQQQQQQLLSQLLANAQRHQQQQAQQVDLAALLGNAGIRPGGGIPGLAPPQQQMPPQANPLQFQQQQQNRPMGNAGYTPQQLAQLQALQARMNPNIQAQPQQPQQTPAQLMALLGVRPPQ